MEQGEASREEYLEDLKAVRYMLGKYEEKPILEPWAFFTWAAFIALGTAISWIVHTVHPLTPSEGFFLIWMPVVIIGGLFEGMAFLSRMRKDSVPVNAKGFLKTIIFLVGFFVVSSLIICSLLPTDAPLPGIVLAWLSCAFFLVGYLSYSSLFYLALVVAIISVPFLFTGWTSDWAYLAAGVVCSLAFLVGGIQYIVSGHSRHG